MALLWPVISWSAWSQPDTLEADTTVECAALASVRLVGLGPSSHIGGGQDM